MERPATNDPSGSVTWFFGQLRAGDPDAAQALWQRFFPRLVALARQPSRHRRLFYAHVCLVRLEFVPEGTKKKPTPLMVVAVPSFCHPERRSLPRRTCETSVVLIQLLKLVPQRGIDLFDLRQVKLTHLRLIGKH